MVDFCIMKYAHPLWLSLWYGVHDSNCKEPAFGNNKIHIKDQLFAFGIKYISKTVPYFFGFLRTDSKTECHIPLYNPIVRLFASCCRSRTRTRTLGGWLCFLVFMRWLPPCSSCGGFSSGGKDPFGLFGLVWLGCDRWWPDLSLLTWVPGWIWRFGYDIHGIWIYYLVIGYGIRQVDGSEF